MRFYRLRGSTSSTALPLNWRSRKACTASATRVSGPRQPTSTRRLPCSTRRTRLTRSGPTGAVMTNELSDRPVATIAYGGKLAGCPELHPMHCTLPPGASRSQAATRAGPPTLSRTRSTGSSTSSTPVTTSSAPRRSSSALCRASEVTAITCAPPYAASCTANRPTPPEAPVTSTRAPLTGASSIPARTACSAARPATGSAAASARSTWSGTFASDSRSTATLVANAPPARATTRVPTGGPPAAVRVTTPATSDPSTAPIGSRPERTSLRSPRFSDAWWVSTTTCPGFGTGAGTSPTRIPPGASGSTSTARIPTAFHTPSPGLHEANASLASLHCGGHEQHPSQRQQHRHQTDHQREPRPGPADGEAQHPERDDRDDPDDRGIDAEPGGRGRILLELVAGPRVLGGHPYHPRLVPVGLRHAEVGEPDDRQQHDEPAGDHEAQARIAQVQRTDAQTGHTDGGRGAVPESAGSGHRVVGRCLLPQRVGHDGAGDQGEQPGHDGHPADRGRGAPGEHLRGDQGRGDRREHDGTHHEARLGPYPVAAPGRGRRCGRLHILDDRAHVAQLGHGLPRGHAGRYARSLQLGNPDREVAPHLLLEVLRLGRHVDAGERLVQQTVDLQPGGHARCLPGRGSREPGRPSRSGRESMMPRVTTQARTLSR